MTAYVVARVRCDNCTSVMESSSQTIKQLRDRSREKGWIGSAGKDYCRTCVLAARAGEA